MALFQLGDFRLHSGAASAFKIDCDALTDGDLECIAFLLSQRLPPFFCVLGVPRGGVRLAAKMHEYVSSDAPSILIVDDVITTGGSITEFRDKIVSTIPVIGAAIFARGTPPDWVTPLFSIKA